MKRISNLYEQIISLENLRLADEKARRGKLRSYGVKRHDRNREANIQALHESLKNKTFVNSKYEVFVIKDPKERLIYRLPYFPDRILHHAIMNVMEPIWVSLFTEDTYSCIKNRGIHKAAAKVKKALKEDPEHTTYCLKMDVVKFYPSIDHDILKMILRKKIKDQDLLWLLDLIIDSADGVPIGNYLSQYFANLVLAYFDHWIKEVKKVKYYFRYADDIVILGDDPKALHKLRVEIEEYLNSNLKLSLRKTDPVTGKKKWKFQVFKVDAHRGIDFVGYIFFHTHTLIRKGIKKNMCRKAAKLNKRKNISDLEYKQTICSWFGWAKYSNSKHLLKTIIKKQVYDTLRFSA
jgi:retron-type reverse transcriptase|nr:MAG TPA_asm: hypothetical protein [Caudoviricetes sp.]